jgi:hypothetical protein
MSKFGAIVDKRRKEQGSQTDSAPVQTPKMGRPRGKRSDPDYEQVTSYLRKDTYQAVKVALIKSGEKMQFSDLMQQLLENWLQKTS